MIKVEINCEDLSKTFSGKTIFKNLSFKISSSQSITITGKNGSGKSTLIKLIANLIHASGGKISIEENQKEILRDNWFKKTGLLSPYLNLYDELTASENLEFFYRLKTEKKIFPENEISSLLKRVNLYEKRNEPLKNYSSGMKQKLKLAFALLTDPPILLLDEPLTNLDKDGVDLVYEICREQKEKGILILATNNEEDKELCERTLNIEDYK